MHQKRILDYSKLNSRKKKTCYGHLLCKNKLPLVMDVPCVDAAALGKILSYIHPVHYCKYRTSGDET